MNELVKINDNNQVTTDSLTVADRFGKRHCDVLRSIKMLKCSKEFGERNFALSSYITEQGKEQPYYDMTYDGWMFLVMGFTGEKAAEWKEKFIVAFRSMEVKLKELSTVPAPVDMKAIGGLVKKCCAVSVREELHNILAGADNPEQWEVSDQDLIYFLHRWHATKNKADTIAFRKLIAERDALLLENISLKDNAKQIKQLANSLKL